MIGRLLLAILLAAFAAPSAATAPCHNAGETMPGVATAAMPAMPPHREHEAAAPHRCIGCMPIPDAISASRPWRRMPARLPRPMPARLLRHPGLPPAAPPPRIG